MMYERTSWTEGANITENFVEKEFRCRCGQCGERVLVSMQLLYALESLRAAMGRPLAVTSGFRCPLHPLSKARPNSYHIKGMAADISTHGMSGKDLHLFMRKAYQLFGGVALNYMAYIHVDVGPKRTWTY